MSHNFDGGILDTTALPTNFCAHIPLQSLVQRGLILAPDAHPQSGFQPGGWGMGCSYYSHPSGCLEEFDPKT